MLVVTHHLGLGDHIVCNGLFRVLLERHKRLLFIVKRHNFHTLRQMFDDLPGIYMIPFPEQIADRAQVFLQSLARIFGVPHLGLGYFGKNFLVPGETIKYDANFYRQAGVDFAHRWSSFGLTRDFGKERAVFESFSISSGTYAFVHEDTGRGFVISRQYISPGLKVIRPQKKSLFTLLNYLRVMEEAAELHFIESSFAALAESLDLRCKKVAHRYARPEASQNSRLEFTYRSEWLVIN